MVLLAYRHFLAKFKMAGEAQIVDRFMTHFAERYCTCCPDVFKFSGANRHQLYPNVCVRLELTVCSGARAETCYMLAFATLMLNTDAHNPQVRDKMSKTAFIANNRYSIAFSPIASRQALIFLSLCCAFPESSLCKKRYPPPSSKNCMIRL